MSTGNDVLDSREDHYVLAHAALSKARSHQTAKDTAVAQVWATIAQAHATLATVESTVAATAGSDVTLPDWYDAERENQA